MVIKQLLSLDVQVCGTGINHSIISFSWPSATLGCYCSL